MGNRQTIGQQYVKKGSLTHDNGYFAEYSPLQVKFEIDRSDEDSILEKTSYYTSDFPVSSSFKDSKKQKETLQHTHRSSSAPLEILHMPKEGLSCNINTQSIIEFFQKRTRCMDFDIIYNSEVNGLDSRSIKSAIQFKEKLLFIFEAPSGIIGFYQEDMIQQMDQSKTFSGKSNDFWIFTIDKKTNINMYKRKEPSKNSFTIYGMDSDNFIGCYCAFWMDNSGTIRFNPLMDSSYKARHSRYTPLPFQLFSKKMKCQRVCVLQC